ncbi:unnamed protein product [Orchesella dallaii]|uniref:Plancitoxin-1 n=1 Tax=Orchesella dallaii TaxID=48710 RepID=A0ABP1Q7X5_9HEXA
MCADITARKNVPKKRSHDTKRKVASMGTVMGVTLISFYCFASYLIISCSFQSAFVIASAAEHNELQQKNDLDNFYNTITHYSHLEHEQQQQANDIFTKLMQPQGQTNDEHRKTRDDVDSRFRSYIGIKRGSKTTSVTKVKVSFEHADALHDANGNIPMPQPQKSMRSASSQTQQPMNCKDELGNDVSWFYAYKLPLLSESTDSLTKEGSKYFYLTPDSTSWVSSEYPINSDKSILANTLDTIWIADRAKEELAQLVYNDQPPNHPAMVMNGHTKGLVLTSPEGGFWLQHSCPHFPNIAAENFSSSYPPGGLINGQMFLCMSLGNPSNVDVVGKVLQYTRPLVYNYTIPTTMQQLLPQLTLVATKNATVKQAPWFTKYELQAGELNLTLFVKGPKFRKEIYSAWIAPEYETSLDVQSWLNGAHPFASNCSSPKFPVLNVLSKVLGAQNFSYTDDHSKWAVSASTDNPITCVGDLNRMKPQKTRGGVAVCVSNKSIWNAFKSLVEVTQPCNMTSLKYFYLNSFRFKVKSN